MGFPNDWKIGLEMTVCRIEFHQLNTEHQYLEKILLFIKNKNKKKKKQAKFISAQNSFISNH